MSGSISKDTKLFAKLKNSVDLAFSGKSKKQRLLYPTLAAFFIILAFILSANDLPYVSLALGAPFADALLCSAGIYTPFVYVGCILGSLYHDALTVPRILTLTFVFVLRIITGIKNVANCKDKALFSEKKITKLAISAVLCFIQCVMYLATAQINPQSAKTVLFTLIFTPTVTIFFSIYYAKESKTRLNRFLYEISMLVIFSFTVYCASDLNYAFFSADTALAVFFILCIAKYGGLARAVTYGFCLGYIASPTYFATFILLGAVSAFLFLFSTYSACGIACAAACICSIILGGATSLISIVPETVMACAVVSPVLRYSFLPSGFPYPLNDAVYADSFSENAKRLINELSFVGTFKNTSNTLRNVNQSVNDAASVFNCQKLSPAKIAESVCSDFCEKCPLCTICLDGAAEQTSSSITELVKQKYENLSSENVPPYLMAQCIKLRELCDYVEKSISDAKESHTPKAIIPTLSYPAVADIITEVALNVEKELVFDSQAEKSVAKLFYSASVPFGSISVIGSKRKKVCIYGSSASKIRKALPDLQIGLKKIFGFPFDAPEISDDIDAPIIFLPAKSLTTEVAFSAASKNGEEFCGDTVITFDDSLNNFYALISDGMGSGASAGRSSAITAELIRSFMLAGIEPSLAIKLAAEALPSLCDEYFSTVALMKLDLVSGEASVIKNHAAASYILRNGSVYCCSANSMPIGISCEVASEKINFRLEDGDTVIMVSDGISEDPSDKVRLPDLIGIEGNLCAKELSSRILEKAIKIKGKSDDMSALVIKIKSA